MKILVLGATGGTGMQLIKRSLASGHSVTAFARNPTPLKAFNGNIQIKTGDLLNREELAAVLPGHHAVLSGFGPRIPLAKSDAHLLRDFGNILTSAMQETMVRRLLLISTAFLFKDSVVPPTYLIGKLFFPSVVTDAAELEAIIERSELDWTIVRPPQLIDSASAEHYRERIGHLPRFGFKISRADVADYFVKSIEDERLIRKVVGISN
jgi:putative NADH-flavin reductase